MPRISIDVTSEQHERLKVLAAERGQSVHDYVLTQSLAEQPLTDDEKQALGELKDLLTSRIREADDGNLVSVDFREVGIEARKRLPR
ncbi:MAG: hypothetical protein KDJ45_05225 [Hyphomicrobiaceae bacterium]|nr:hypothetical protein [Hyphomicrobiaceae bacterium]MCC0009639.1 antitoxin [Hyphomicrobiaceae bacterium]